MHDGSVGGGRKGVNRSNFLIWSGERPVPVQDSQGGVRLGLQVAPLKPRLIASHIERFAQKVMDFKRAVRSGEIPNDSITEQNRQSWKDYYHEFSGQKRGQRAAEFEYVSRHGDIVDALCEWRRKHGHPGGRIVKSVYLDLGVAVADKLTEIYEVKPSAHRQALYTGIGQILVLTEPESRRYLVVPNGERIPNDVSQALARFGIRVLRFKLRNSTVEILGRER